MRQPRRRVGQIGERGGQRYRQTVGNDAAKAVVQDAAHFYAVFVHDCLGESGRIGQGVIQFIPLAEGNLPAAGFPARVGRPIPPRPLCRSNRPGPPD